MQWERWNVQENHEDMSFSIQNLVRIWPRFDMDDARRSRLRPRGCSAMRCGITRCAIKTCLSRIEYHWFTTQVVQDWDLETWCKIDLAPDLDHVTRTTSALRNQAFHHSLLFTLWDLQLLGYWISWSPSSGNISIPSTQLSYSHSPAAWLRAVDYAVKIRVNPQQTGIDLNVKHSMVCMPNRLYVKFISQIKLTFVTEPFRWDWYDFSLSMTSRQALIAYSM